MLKRELQAEKERLEGLIDERDFHLEVLREEVSHWKERYNESLQGRKDLEQTNELLQQTIVSLSTIIHKLCTEGAVKLKQ